MSEVYIAATRTDGSVVHVAFQTRMRAPAHPKGPWRLGTDGVFEREASDANIEFELSRHAHLWGKVEGVTIASWRRLSQEEHEMFNRDRAYRDALEDAGGKIQHNISKARECCRNEIRRRRGARLMQLDGQWMRAFGQNDALAAATIEVERQKLRDAPADPRIAAAERIEDLLEVTRQKE